MNTKRMACVVSVFLLSLIAATTLAATNPSTTGSAAEYKFKWNGFYPANTINAKQHEVFYMDRVTELSKGRIQWEYFPNLQLGKDQLTIIGSGVAQAGLVVGALNSGTIPLLGGMDLPFLYKNTDFLGHIRVVQAMLKHQDMANAFAKFNLKVIGANCVGTLDLWSKKPIKVMADFKGLKLRSAGALQSATFIALGASAQSLQSSEVYLALSTGVIDASVWSAASAWDGKIYEVTKYCTIPSGSVGSNSVPSVMNMDTYNKLPKDLKDVLAQAGADAEEYVAKESVKSNEKALADFAAKGMDIYAVPADEIFRWRAATQSVYDKWLQSNGAAGQRILDFALQKLGEKK
jgi:TRAP-type C4-dicarboxylate transport system substrate-binding protein